MKFEPESRCGVSCAAFPCEILMEYEKQPGKAEWVKAARADVDPVSVCGHHCDFCFLGQWCGVCRS